jgi:uridine kinase
MAERLKVNYDHPLAFDNDLLAQHLRDLSTGKRYPKTNVRLYGIHPFKSGRGDSTG